MPPWRRHCWTGPRHLTSLFQATPIRCHVASRAEPEEAGGEPARPIGGTRSLERRPHSKSHGGGGGDKDEGRREEAQRPGAGTPGTEYRPAPPSVYLTVDLGHVIDTKCASNINVTECRQVCVCSHYISVSNMFWTQWKQRHAPRHRFGWEQRWTVR